MAENEVKQLVGILDQFDRGTIMVATREMGIESSIGRDTITFEKVVEIKKQCAKESEATKKGAWASNEIVADQSAQNKARVAASGGCGTECPSKNCKYTETKYKLVDTEERQNESNITEYRSKVTSIGNCGCE